MRLLRPQLLGRPRRAHFALRARLLASILPPRDLRRATVAPLQQWTRSALTGRLASTRGAGRLASARGAPRRGGLREPAARATRPPPSPRPRRQARRPPMPPPASRRRARRSTTAGSPRSGLCCRRFARPFIALVAGRFPRGTRVYDNFTRALAVARSRPRTPPPRTSSRRRSACSSLGKASDLLRQVPPRVLRAVRRARLAAARGPARARRRLSRLGPAQAQGAGAGHGEVDDPDLRPAGRTRRRAARLCGLLRPPRLGGGEDPDDETLADDMRAKAKKARWARSASI